MYEKYMDELLDLEDDNVVNDKYNVILKYDLKDAWERTIKGFTILEDSIYLISGNLENPIKYSLKDNKIKEILNKYSKKIDEIKDQSLPNLPIMDGYINKIDFKANDKWYNFNFYNLGYYSEEDLNSNKFLSLIFELLDNLYDEIQKQVPDIESYFILVDDEDEEVEDE